MIIALSDKFGGLKKLEVLGTDAGTHPHEYGYTGYMSSNTLELTNFINYQVGLETLVIEGFEDIVKAEDEERYGECDSSYDGFEAFYNYLPYYVISKQSFMFLRVSLCHIPINSFETMISIFLNSPTSHDQSLEIEDCEFTVECNDTFPDYPLSKQVREQCVCGEHKSLSIPVNNPRFSPQWLFDYPNLQLKRLELSYCSNGDLKLQCLDTCPTAAIDNLCCRFFHVGYKLSDEDVQGITKLLELPSLSEVEFVNFSTSTLEDGLLSVMTNIFSQRPFRLPSLRRFSIDGMFINGISPPMLNDVEHLSVFFNALFGIPKKQLAELTLELKKGVCMDGVLQAIAKSWKTSGNSQKIKKLNCLFYYSGNSEDRVPEPLKEIAVNSDITFVM